jgi:hypothetical protein
MRKEGLFIIEELYPSLYKNVITKRVHSFTRKMTAFTAMI